MGPAIKVSVISALFIFLRRSPKGSCCAKGAIRRRIILPHNSTVSVLHCLCLVITCNKHMLRSATRGTVCIGGRLVEQREQSGTLCARLFAHAVVQLVRSHQEAGFYLFNRNVLAPLPHTAERVLLIKGLVKLDWHNSLYRHLVKCRSFTTSVSVSSLSSLHTR